MEDTQNNQTTKATEVNEEFNEISLKIKNEQVEKDEQSKEETNPSSSTVRLKRQSRGDYFQEKNSKLIKQMERDRQDVGAISDLFKGVVAYVNIGASAPYSTEDVKQNLLKHGGTWAPFEMDSSVTHHVAINLPVAKLKKLINVKKRKKHFTVHPDWIMESVKQGKLLRCEDFVPLFVDEPGQQKITGFSSSLKGSSTLQTEQDVQHSIEDQVVVDKDIIEGEEENNEDGAKLANIFLSIPISSEASDLFRQFIKTCISECALIPSITLQVLSACEVFVSAPLGFAPTLVKRLLQRVLEEVGVTCSFRLCQQSQQHQQESWIINNESLMQTEQAFKSKPNSNSSSFASYLDNPKLLDLSCTSWRSIASQGLAGLTLSEATIKIESLLEGKNAALVELQKQLETTRQPITNFTVPADALSQRTSAEEWWSPGERNRDAQSAIIVTKLGEKIMSRKNVKDGEWIGLQVEVKSYTRWLDKTADWKVLDRIEVVTPINERELLGEVRSAVRALLLETAVPPSFVGVTIRWGLNDEPEKNKKKESIAMHASKNRLPISQEIYPKSPLHRLKVMPQTLSEVDLDELNALPEDLRKEILESLQPQASSSLTESVNKSSPSSSSMERLAKSSPHGEIYHHHQSSPLRLGLDAIMALHSDLEEDQDGEEGDYWTRNSESRRMRQMASTNKSCLEPEFQNNRPHIQTWMESFDSSCPIADGSAKDAVVAYASYMFTSRHFVTLRCFLSYLDRNTKLRECPTCPSQSNSSLKSRKCWREVFHALVRHVQRISIGVLDEGASFSWPRSLRLPSGEVEEGDGDVEER